MTKRAFLLSALLLLIANGLAAAPGFVPAPAASTFRVVAYNAEWLFDGVNDPIDHWGSPALAQQHLEAVAAELRPLEADYISLAEVEDATILSRLNALLGNVYAPIFIQGNDTSTGQDTAALSVLPPQTAKRTDERVSYPVAGSALRCGGGTAGVSKNYCADFDLAGTPTTIIGVHFLAYPDRCDRSIEREAQASVIRNLARETLLRGREVILLGDFNDFDGVTLDAASNRPISQVLAVLKDLDPATEGDELVNAARGFPKTTATATGTTATGTESTTAHRSTPRSTSFSSHAGSPSAWCLSPSTTARPRERSQTIGRLSSTSRLQLRRLRPLASTSLACPLCRASPAAGAVSGRARSADLCVSARIQAIGEPVA